MSIRGLKLLNVHLNIYLTLSHTKGTTAVYYCTSIKLGHSEETHPKKIKKNPSI